jgi:hypothetical protein
MKISAVIPIVPIAITVINIKESAPGRDTAVRLPIAESAATAIQNADLPLAAVVQL